MTKKACEQSLLMSKLMKHGSNFTDSREVGALGSYFSRLISIPCISGYVNSVLRGTGIGVRCKTQKQWSKSVSLLAHTD